MKATDYTKPLLNPEFKPTLVKCGVALVRPKDLCNDCVRSGFCRQTRYVHFESLDHNKIFVMDTHDGYKIIEGAPNISVHNSGYDPRGVMCLCAEQHNDEFIKYTIEVLDYCDEDVINYEPAVILV